MVMDYEPSDYRGSSSLETQLFGMPYRESNQLQTSGDARARTLVSILLHDLYESIRQESSKMIRHKVISGICYLYEVKETSKGRCLEHNPPKSTPERDAKK